MSRICLAPPALLAAVLTGLLAPALASPALAQDQPAKQPAAPAPPKKDSLDRDYGPELPRIEPLAPEQAVRQFDVAEGFEIQLVAAEPQVVDPIAVAFDAANRMYVVEMRDYSEQETERLGRIRRLEDRDGDGRYEHSVIFAEDLSWPTAVTCWDGGVFVGAPPHLYYLRDDDGDGRADHREIVLTGFARSNVQGLLNSFTWGLDNRIHAATSSSGASLVRPDGDPATALSLRRRDFAWDPRTMEVDPVSGGAQHGLSFNRWGDKFVCSNSDHCQAVLFEDRYLARNPLLASGSPRRSIAVDGPQADVFRASPVEPWRIVRTRLRAQKIVPGVVEGGGRPAGYFTGATGVTIYRGDNWPQQFLDWAVVGDVGSNLVHRKRLTRSGVTWTAERFDRESEFVRSRDIWFRPVQFANGPDGALYICDMYREVIEHPKSLPPIIKQHLDLTSGRDRGRIYRVVSADKQRRTPPDLSATDDAALAGLLGHANGWTRETAARLLVERDAFSVAPQLRGQATDADFPPTGRLRSLYVLASLAALDEPTLAAAIGDPHPEVRRHAVRLCEQIDRSARLEAALCGMTDDPSLRVRYQLAFTLGELQTASKSDALARLVIRDGQSSDMNVAIDSSLGRDAGAVAARLLQDEDGRGVPHVRAAIGRLAAQIGKTQQPGDVAALMRGLRSLPADEKSLLQEVASKLSAQPGSPLARELDVATGGRSAAAIAEYLDEAAATAANEGAEPQARAQAVHRLQLSRFDKHLSLWKMLLSPEQPADVQSAVLSTFGAWEDPQIATLVLQRWAGMTPRLRSQAGDLLLSRDGWTPALLAALESGEVSLADIDRSRLQLLQDHPDASVAGRAASLLKRNPRPGRAEVVEAYRPALEQPGDAARGRMLFKKNCSACHRLDGVGHEIGPSLAAMRTRGREAVLLNVLDPNREVNPQYLSYAVRTSDGRSLSGMIEAETAASVQLQLGENKREVILRSDIEAMKSTGLSLMPEGLEKEIDRQAMADLLQYLVP